MATLDNSPSLFLGQPWTAWADRLPIQDREAVDGAEPSVSGEVESRAGSMRLRKEDMNFFGMCPSKDDFYLAVCEHCGQVIKPQALEKHMALRHANAPSLPTPTPSPVLSYPSNSPAGFNNSSSESNANTPQKSQPSSSSPPPLLSSIQTDNVRLKDVSQMIITAKAVTAATTTARTRTPSPQNVKLTSTPPNTPKTMPSQLKKNHTVPIVKMERSMLAQAELANLKKSQTMTLKKANSSNTITSTVNNNTNTNTNSNSSVKNGTSSTTTTTTSKSSAVTTSKSGPANSKTSTPSSKSNTPTTTTKSGSTTKKNLPRKLLPCKDREFDVNKHCGVWLTEMQKHCTRSLTCKTHALSLRRAVAGRRKPFDELLSEHRARREKEMQLASQAKLLQQQKLLQQNTSSGFSTDDSINKTPSPPKSTSSHTHKRPLQCSSTPTGVHLLSTAATTTHHSDNKAGSDVEYDDDFDSSCPYINHHPKPVAVCSFGARLMGRGYYAFDRKSDYVRSSFMSVVERHLHPPPFKKLCVASPKSAVLGTTSTVMQALQTEKSLPTYSTAISAMSGKMSPTVANGPLNKSQNSSSKKYKPSSKQIKSKDGLSASMSRSKSRRKSGGSSSGGGGGISPASVMPGLTTASNSLGSLTIPLQSGNASGFQINPATYTEMGQNAILSSSTGNLIKDLSIVVTNIDANVNNGLTPGQVINGVTTGHPHMIATNARQIMTSNLAGQLAAVNQQLSTTAQTGQLSNTGLQFHTSVPIANAAQLANLSTANFNANISASMQGNVICTVGDVKQSNIPMAKTANANKPNARSRNKSGKQTSRVHRQSSVTSCNRIDSSFDTASSGPPSAQPSPSSISMTPSPNFRPGSISPQISVHSPLPNGIIPSPSAINLKGFSVNHFPTVTISPSRNSTPSPITITSSTEASPNNSGHFNTAMFTQTAKSTSAAATRANTNFQKQIHKQHQHQSLTPQQSPVQQLQTQLQQHQPHHIAGIVATGQIFPNMQQLQPKKKKVPTATLR